MPHDKKQFIALKQIVINDKTLSSVPAEMNYINKNNTIKTIINAFMLIEIIKSAKVEHIQFDTRVSHNRKTS